MTPNPVRSRRKVVAVALLAVAAVLWGWRWATVSTEAVGPRRMPPIHWRPANQSERTGAIASITSQLQAFARDDYKNASYYQSSGLRRNFASVKQFRAMMREHYPQFANYKSVQFGPAQADATGRFVQIPVKLTGRDGVTVHALYMMLLENKIYRVSGVTGGDSPPSAKPHKAEPPTVSA